ncbi:MAG: hypothetical protein RL226_1691, partial [Bacteroidota bacterium]
MPITISVVLLFTAIFILGYSYQKQIEHYQSAELTRLNAIAQTTAGSIDGDLHLHLTQNYKDRDQIASTEENEAYKSIHEQLLRVQRANKVETDIYTLFLDQDSIFFFAVTSGAEPYFRHTWKPTGPEHLARFKKGALVGPYQDDHGVWLSAFSPIYSSTGEVVAVVQVDEQFNSFIERVRQALLSELFIVLIVFLIVVVMLFRNVSRHMRREDLFKQRLEFQTNLINKKNQDITDSLRSAEHIQKMLLPDMNEVEQYFESAVLFLPRDIVGGDFFWFKNTGRYL